MYHGLFEGFFHCKIVFFLLIHNMTLLQGRVAITTDVGVENRKKSKNVCCSCSQIPRVLISTRASFELLDDLLCSSSPDYGVSLGAILVSLHTSDIIFAVRSRKLLCRMYLKLPFLKLILC